MIEGIEVYTATGILNALQYNNAYVDFTYFDGRPRRVRVDNYTTQRTYGVYPVDIDFRMINPGATDEYLQVLSIHFRPDLENDFMEY